MLGPIIEESVKELAESRGDVLFSNFRGSIIAETELRNGEMDLGIIAVPRGRDLPSESEYKIYPLAYFVVTVVVNDANTVYQLSVDQLSGILSSQKDKGIENWGDLGMQGIWQNRAINPVLTTNKVALNLEILRAATIKSEPLKAAVTIAEKPDDVVARVIDDSAAIGTLPYGVDSKKLKVMQIAPQGEQVAFLPTEDNIYYGDYPLTLPFYIVVPRDKVGKVEPYLKQLLSNTIADELQKNYLMPLPRANRQQYSLELDVN